jgi:hypothetical protein
MNQPSRYVLENVSPTSYLKLWKWWFILWKCQVSSLHGSINWQTDVTLLPNKHVVWCTMSLILPDSIPWKTTSYQFNGNSRILKWWYVSTIFLTICGDIPWNLGLIYICLIYMVGTSNKSVPEMAIDREFSVTRYLRNTDVKNWKPPQLGGCLQCGAPKCDVCWSINLINYS